MCKLAVSCCAPPNHTADLQDTCYTPDVLCASVFPAQTRPVLLWSLDYYCVYRQLYVQVCVSPTWIHVRPCLRLDKVELIAVCCINRTLVGLAKVGVGDLFYCAGCPIRINAVELAYYASHVSMLATLVCFYKLRWLVWETAFSRYMLTVHS